MRLIESRYSRDFRRYNLALRMLSFEVRTSTISRFTGLTSARIRTLGRSDYAIDRGALPRRHRGPAPYRISTILTDPRMRGDVNLVAAIVTLLDGPPRGTESSAVTVELRLGEFVCDLYEVYLKLAERRTLTFEQTALIYRSLVRAKQVSLSACVGCGALVVLDALAIEGKLCRQCVQMPIGLVTGVDSMALPRVAEEVTQAFQLSLF
jgi:hypothetical protein